MQFYLNSRVLRIFILGIASGFPWVMIGSALTLWLKDAGLSRTDIGFAGAIFAVYSINFFWAPLLDKHKPFLFAGFGRRKSWIIPALLLITIVCFLIAQTNPIENARLTVLLCLVIAVCSATQDIAIDAYRIDSIPEDQNYLIPAAAAMATAGWWTGFSGLGALIIYLSDFPEIGWNVIYQICGLIALFLVLIISLFPKVEKQDKNIRARHNLEGYISLVSATQPGARYLAIALSLYPVAILLWVIAGAPLLSEEARQHPMLVPVLFVTVIASLVSAIYLLSSGANGSQQSNAVENSSTPNVFTYIAAYLLSTLGQPFASFFQKTGIGLAVRILLFIFLFKIGEAFLGRMSILFYSELGFSNSEIAQYSKLLSWWVTIVVSLVGGWFTIRFGTVKGLVLAGIAMASSNCLFSLLAMVGPEQWLFATTVIVDGITSAWSNVAFVAFISLLVDRNYSASQYALFASLGTMGRTVLSSASGSWVDALDGNWALFFLLTALMVIPALLLLRSMTKQPHLVALLQNSQLYSSQSKSN